MEKSVIIIGAGTAGLSTGIYGQMNGYKTSIFEMDIKPGGLCTAWERKGYIIDGCLHWLVGTSAESSFHRLWQEVGVLQGKEIINLDQYCRIEGQDGKVFIFYTAVDSLEKHMLEIAPEDAALIAEVTGAVRHFTRFNPPVDKAAELYSPLDNIKNLAAMSPFLGDMRKWGKITVKEMAERFKNPLLRLGWQTAFPPEFSAFAALMQLSYMSAKNAGYIIGGSLEVSLSMEKRYLDLGGKIAYNSRVTKVLVENNRAVGIRLEDGSEHRADYVVSAADGHATIFEMLEEKYIDDTIRDYYRGMPLFPGLVFIGLGVNSTFSDVPQAFSGMVIPLEKPITIGGKENKVLFARIHSFDRTLAPEGKTLVTVMIESEYTYWETLSQDTAKYKAEKERIAVAVVAALSKRFTGLAGKLEMWDVATPMTFLRYTGNWKGSYEGWLLTPRNFTLQMKKTLPGLDNFYMVGQWVAPGGGLPSGLITGYHLVQVLCKRDRQPFKTALPPEPAKT
jgi:phytoene dehydrogenase-like protein